VSKPFLSLAEWPRRIKMENKAIGTVHVDNGVGIDIILTPHGIKYEFWDLRTEEVIMYNSKYRAIGEAEERGFNVQPFTTMSAIQTYRVYQAARKLDLSFDEAKELLESR
jgi:hypothetical protein